MNSPNSAVTFPHVSPQDYALIREMALEIWPEVYREIISEDQMLYMIERMYSAESISCEVGSGGIIYQWILETGKRVGYLAFGPVEAKKPCTLHKFYLLPKRHGEGLGSTTLKGLIKKLSESGVTELNLRVNRHNDAAIRCYNRNGFETIAEDCLDIGDGHVMDDFIMRRVLHS